MADPAGIYRNRRRARNLIAMSLFACAAVAGLWFFGSGAYVKEVPVPVSLGGVISSTLFWNDTRINLDRPFRIIVSGEIESPDSESKAGPDGLPLTSLPDSLFKTTFIPTGDGHFRKERVLDSWKLALPGAPFLSVIGKTSAKGPAFPIGSQADLPLGGNLYLGVNDFVEGEYGPMSMAFASNRGQFVFRLEPR